MIIILHDFPWEIWLNKSLVKMKEINLVDFTLVIHYFRFSITSVIYITSHICSS